MTESKEAREKRLKDKRLTDIAKVIGNTKGIVHYTSNARAQLGITIEELQKLEYTSSRPFKHFEMAASHIAHAIEYVEKGRRNEQPTDADLLAMNEKKEQDAMETLAGIEAGTKPDIFAVSVGKTISLEEWQEQNARLASQSNQQDLPSPEEQVDRLNQVEQELQAKARELLT